MCSQLAYSVAAFSLIIVFLGQLDHVLCMFPFELCLSFTQPPEVRSARDSYLSIRSVSFDATASLQTLRPVFAHLLRACIWILALGLTSGYSCVLLACCAPGCIVCVLQAAGIFELLPIQQDQVLSLVHI